MANEQGELLSLPQIDQALRLYLQPEQTEDGRDWSYRGRARRAFLHTFFGYPAMMVPEMQGDLLDAVLGYKPNITKIYEPYVGSGTVLSQVMLRGRAFIGVDINPLAILICQVKSGPFYVEGFRARTEELTLRIRRDRSTRVEADFPGLNKWFSENTIAELSKIRRAIRNEEYKWCRRLFWVTLAETVRLTSNSRTSTFKLHIRPQDEIQARNLSPINIFLQLLDENINRINELKVCLEDKGYLEHGRYKYPVEILFGDSTKTRFDNNSTPQPDLLVSSPPYGDNTTTVPYGQQAYLPLQWIDLGDIDEKITQEWVTTAYKIDHHSLGGSLLVDGENIKDLCARSEHFAHINEQLQNEPKDRIKRVAAYIRDLDKSLDSVTASLAPNSYMIWTVGDRRVGGRTIPTTNIMAELLQSRGSILIAQTGRDIPSKRMALRNSVTSTMRTENIIILRTGSS